MNRRQGRTPPVAADTEQIGRSFQIPYRLTDTNHFLVRVRINGKGPFNFLVDSGCTGALRGDRDGQEDRVEARSGRILDAHRSARPGGGARLEGVKARVEDPFQLVGMNALGFPGALIDGILGFTILARFRLEIDLTQDRMTWTRLADEPRDPPVPKVQPGEDAAPPLGVQAMSTPGVIREGAGPVLGKQPEEEQRGRGFSGSSGSSGPNRAGSEVEISRRADRLAGDRRRASIRRPDPRDQPAVDRGHQRAPAPHLSRRAARR